MGDDFVQNSQGTVAQKINIQGFTDTITFHVIDMVEGVDIILGCHWLRKRKVILNWGSKTATVRKAGRVHTLHPQHVAGNTLVWSGDPTTKTAPTTFKVLSYAEARKQLSNPKADYIRDWELLQVREDVDRKTDTLRKGKHTVEHQLESRQLDAEIQKLKMKYGDTLFQEKLAGCRDPKVENEVRQYFVSRKTPA